MLKKVSKYIKRNANIPNTLTLVRLILVPVYWIVFFSYSNPLNTCFIIFCVSSLTDFLDGHIARKYNLITDFGKLFDPVADKLMVVSVLVSHYIIGSLDEIPILIIAIKETLLILGGAIMLKKYNIVVYSNFYGKAAMVSFIVALTLLFFHSKWIEINIPLDTIFVWISVVLSLLSFVIYAIQAYKMTQKSAR